MSAFIVHKGALVFCSHLGTADPVLTNTRVKINGMEAAMLPVPYKVSGCVMPPPIAGNGPCVIGMWNSGSIRVRSLGLPFVLANSGSNCLPTSTPLVVLVTQFRVKAT